MVSTALLLTHLRLRGVVRLGPPGAGGRVAVPLGPAGDPWAGVATDLALEGAEPRAPAGPLQEGHVVDGDAPVEAPAQHLEYQLRSGDRGPSFRGHRRNTRRVKIASVKVELDF